MFRTRFQGIISVAAAILTYHANFSVAGDTEIWPIPTTCPVEDPLDFTVHLQHESDCSKFYKCDHGEKVLFDCPGGLHFNPLLQVCDWPAQANCTLNDRPPTSPDTTTPEPTTTTPEPTTTTPEPTTTTPEPTTTTPEPTTTTPEPTTTTPEPTTTTPEPTTTTPEPTTTTTTEPTTTPQATPPADLDPDCPWPDPLNYTVHLPHETDCSKFYKCDNGKKVEFDCPDDLHFNKELEVCDWPSNANCSAPSSTTVQPSTATTPAPQCPNVNCQNSTIYLPVLSNPRKYTRCVNGEEIVQACPGNLVFDRVLATCNLEHLVAP